MQRPSLTRQGCTPARHLTTPLLPVALSASGQPRPLPTAGPCLDLFAPGVDIYSACGGPSRCEAVTDSAYTYASGTSMSVPHVAGGCCCRRNGGEHSTAVEPGVVHSSVTMHACAGKSAHVPGKCRRCGFWSAQGLQVLPEHPFLCICLLCQASPAHVPAHNAPRMPRPAAQAWRRYTLETTRPLRRATCPPPSSAAPPPTRSRPPSSRRARPTAFCTARWDSSRRWRRRRARPQGPLAAAELGRTRMHAM